jgi:hypothetical protein
MFGFNLGAAFLFFALERGGDFLVLAELECAKNCDGNGGNPACPGEAEFFLAGVGEGLAALGAVCGFGFVPEAAEGAEEFHGGAVSILRPMEKSTGADWKSAIRQV